MIGVCGNDVYGRICVESLNRAGVDTSNIEMQDVKTRQYHIDISNGKVLTSSVCPKCNGESWYNTSKLSLGLPFRKLEQMMLS